MMEIRFGGAELNAKWTKYIWNCHPTSSPIKYWWDKRVRKQGELITGELNLIKAVAQIWCRIWLISPSLYLEDRGVGLQVPENKQTNKQKCQKYYTFISITKGYETDKEEGTCNQKSGKSVNRNKSTDKLVGTDKKFKVSVINMLDISYRKRLI